MRLALPLVAIVALGGVIVIGSGWGGLWLYGFGVGLSLSVVVLLVYGGPAIEALGRAHNLSAYLDTNTRSRYPRTRVRSRVAGSGDAPGRLGGRRPGL
jgi:hypothetical protein